MAIAKLLERRPHIVPGKYKVSELFFDVPKDYSKPDEETLRLFARSIQKYERPAQDPPEEEAKQLPWFLYLQGGPGYPCRSPQGYPYTKTVLDKGYQMLFLDQRGTGLSSPISAATLSREGTPKQQAQYLKLFRADSIIRDCEAVRKCLTKDYPEKKQKWSVLGQSFGGFCAVTYLSQFPEGLKEVFTCGGLPPLINTPDQAYTQTYKKVVQRNEAYYTKYAEDVPRVHQICKYLDSSSPLLPSQIPLTSRRFLQIGLAFGFHGGFESVHDVILKAATELDTIGMMTRSTLASIDSNLDFDQNVLYAILHEPIYCQGAASNWSAHRVKKHFPQFESFGENTNYSLDNPIYFAGEMIYPWMFTDYAELQALQPVAEILAAVDDWPTLYDTEQLAKNEVPVYSATYMEDMYVDFGFARNTASKIRGCKEFITNVLYHNALGSKSDEVMKQLFAMRDDVVD